MGADPIVSMNAQDGNKTGESILRSCQLVQLRILHVLDSICKENNIQYCLAYGSLLGAIRHGGFIPWDDDLDVWMQEDDYRHFIKIARAQLPDDIMLHTPDMTPRVAFRFSKLRDKNSFMLELGQGMSVNDPSGIWIDIFPLEVCPRLPPKIITLLSQCVLSPWFRTKWIVNKITNPVNALLYAPIALVCRLVSLLFGAVWIISKTALPGKYEIVLDALGGRRLFDKDKMTNLKRWKFEDGEFPVPSDYEPILKLIYGDWRKIPPPEQRPRHAKIIDPIHAAQ